MAATILGGKQIPEEEKESFLMAFSYERRHFPQKSFCGLLRSHLAELDHLPFLNQRENTKGMDYP